MSYASTILADGPIGFWELGETSFASPAADAVGNQNGVYTNTAGLTFSQTGIAGGGGATAVRFTRASSGWMSVASNAALQVVGNTAITLEIWAKKASDGTTQSLFGSTGASCLTMRFETTNKLSAVVPAVAAVCSSTNTVTADSNFHHCVLTATGSNGWHLYIDGVDVTGTVTDHSYASAQAWAVGQDPVGGSAFTDGALQFAALYKKVLTAAQVKTHYRLGLNLSPVNTVAPVASGSTTIGSVVSVTNGTWTDAGSPTFTYQWKRNGTPIGGATSATYTLVAADDATTILCTVTDTDSTGLAASADSNALTDTTPIPTAAVNSDDTAAIYAAHLSQI